VITPQPSPESAFYLRAWYTQALPPSATFSWLPMATIADGQYLDGNVVVPAIFPGPLLISPIASSITDAGVAQIVAEATKLGMLDQGPDFTGGTTLPGSRTAQLVMIVDGVTHELVGNPDLTIQCVRAPCEAPPGTPEAFASFWQDLGSTGSWLADDLGPSAPYLPERVALMLSTAVPSDPSLPANPVEWPFETPLADSGVPYPGGEVGDRCVTLSGAALDAMLPILQSGNQLTVLVDSTGTVRAPIPRVLMPLEPSPCPDSSV